MGGVQTGRRHGMLGVAIAAALSALAGAGAAASAEMPQLAPHRALYHMTLDRVHAGSGVGNVSGDMAIEWLRACDGWTFEHKSAMTVEFAAGESARLSTSATSWESFDGLRYRFLMRNRTNDEESEKIEGTAMIERPGGGGKAVFTAPKPRTDVLPAGTLLPVAHTIEVLRTAMRTPRALIYPAVVFDGMGDDGPLNVTTTIGKAGKGAVGGAKPAEGLAGRPLWPVHLAYFRLDSPDPKPKQEIGMWLYDNGVADNLVIGFDDFVVRARLVRLEYVTPPNCGG